MGADWAACFQSASAKTMLGDLPPSSRETRFTSGGGGLHDLGADGGGAGEADFANEGMAHEGFADFLARTGKDLQGAGRQAGFGADVRRGEGRSEGERRAGLRMTQLPAARAGAVFQQAMGKGKFQGTIAATTPIGWRKVKSRPPRATGMVWPQNLEMAPA